jgi:hypothetical protein
MAGGLPRGVDRMAPEVPAALALRAMRHLAADALTLLEAERRGVRAPPVLTVLATRLTQGHTRRAGCRGQDRAAPGETSCGGHLCP